MPTTPPSYQQLPSGPRPANPPASRQDRVDADEGEVAQVSEGLEAVAVSAHEAATAVAAPSSSHAEALLPGLGDSAPEKGTESAAAGGASAETPPAKGGAREESLIEEEEEDVQERGGKQKEAEEEVSGEEGLEIAQESANDEVQGADLSPFEVQATEATDGDSTALAVAEGAAPQAPASGSTTADAAGERRQLREQADGGAEAGAGSTRATATTGERTPCSPAASEMSSSAPGEHNTHAAERWGGRNREASGEIKTEDRGKDREAKTKKVGLWELKAEKSRLEHALVEAEADRDVERARATEAADRVEEAIARLESLRQRCGVQEAVGADEAAAAGLVG
ncbi:unnamed protein product [Ectocarpus fasciculatus]